MSPTVTPRLHSLEIPTPTGHSQEVHRLFYVVSLPELQLALAIARSSALSIWDFSVSMGICSLRMKPTTPSVNPSPVQKFTECQLSGLHGLPPAITYHKAVTSVTATGLPHSFHRPPPTVPLDEKPDTLLREALSPRGLTA